MKEMLSKTECSAMRGIAILAIMLHNYCHFIGGIVRENEYRFYNFNNDRLWQVLSNPNELLPVHLLSYFGHYGVPVFLFLSGYGLVKKYESGDATTRSIPFLRYHYLKLFRMLIVGFVLFLIVDTLTPGRFAFHWDNVIAQLLMYINVLPEPNRIIWPGIYWFFGLMMELYIVYRLLLYRRSSWIVIALMVICWQLQALCEPDGDTLNRLRYNFIGGMLPFGLGIILARVPNKGTISLLMGNQEFAYGKLLVWLLLIIFSCMLTFVMSYYFQTWLWIPAIIILGCIAMMKAMPEWLLKVFVWFGSISAAMFVAHPITRKLFISIALKQDPYDGLMVYVVVTIALSWAVKQVIDRIPSPRL